MQGFLHWIPISSRQVFNSYHSLRILPNRPSFFFNQRIVHHTSLTVATSTTSRSPVARFRVFHNGSQSQHVSPSGSHPEKPERVDAILRALRDDSTLQTQLSITSVHHDIDDVRLQPAIERVHIFPDYLSEIQKICDTGGGQLDPDTYLTADSWVVAREAVQTWVDAADAAVAHGVAFAAARPPGHHATPANGMGFCILSNAAIAARYLQAALGFERVGVLDFDVHHGNGTEAAVKNVKGIRFVSSHQYPWYPGSGAPGVSGEFGGVRNFVLQPGCDGVEYRKVFEEMLEFVKSDDGVQAVVVSAGFDAMESDYIAEICLGTEDYKWMGKLLKMEFGNVPVVFGLEGGYDVSENGIGEAVRMLVHGWLEDPHVKEESESDEENEVEKKKEEVERA